MLRPSKHRDLPRICRIDMSAFVAVLIILYFVSGGVLPTHGDLGGQSVPVDLFRASHGAPKEIPFDAINVSLQRDGKIFFQSQQLSSSDLSTVIQERVSQGAKRRVYLWVDSKARYRTVSDTLCSVRNAGVADVTIMVSPR